MDFHFLYRPIFVFWGWKAYPKKNTKAGNLSSMSINKSDVQVALIAAVFLLLGAVISLMAYYNNKTLMSVRAYVAGEGHWSKAQKSGSLLLSMYITTGEEEYHEQFIMALEVNLFDRIARETLSEDKPDFDLAEKSLRMAGNPEEDLHYLIWMFDRFKNVSFMAEAIQIWKEADFAIEKLLNLADSIHHKKKEAAFTEQEINEFLKELIAIDQEVTELEYAFSNQINYAAHVVNRIMTIGVISVTLVLIAAVAVFVILFTRRIGMLNSKIAESESKLKYLLRHSRDPIFQIDVATGEYVYISDAMKSMLGYDVDEVIRKGTKFMMSKVHPDDINQLPYDNGTVIRDELGRPEYTQSNLRFLRADGEYLWVSINRTVIRDKDGKPKYIIGNVRDITNIKNYQDQLNASLNEKNLLLSEVHHRVKNNLAIISALLMMQAETTEEKQAVEALKKSQHRVKSIADVHEMLYKSGDFNSINVREYFESMFQRVRELNMESAHIKLVLESDLVDVSLEQGVPLGLLVNELITNSFKHAFSGRERGEIRLIVQENENYLEITYTDNGKGIPEDRQHTANEGSSLGTQLILALLHQLGASYEFDYSQKGYFLKFSFPVTKNGS